MKKIIGLVLAISIGICLIFGRGRTDLVTSCEAKLPQEKIVYYLPKREDEIEFWMSKMA